VKRKLFDTAALPAEPDLSKLPARVDRATAAALVTRYFFSVSPRTLEAWPLATRRVNGKAHIETAELLAVARARFDAAPRVMSGRRARGHSAEADAQSAA